MTATIRPRSSAASLVLAALAILCPAVTGAAPGESQPPVADAPAAASRARAHGPRAPARTVAPRPPFAGTPAPVAPGAPLKLALTDAEMRAILLRPGAAAEEGAHSAFDEVTVTAPAALLPARDPTQDVWGGIAAPLWAFLHPSEAWRIFLPIPAK